MFFGKYTLHETGAGVEAVRELEGRGRILHRPGGRSETLPLRDLIATAATVPVDAGRSPGAHATRLTSSEPPRRGRPAPGAEADEGPGHIASRRWQAVPPELDRLVWTEVRRAPEVAVSTGASNGSDAFARLDEGPPANSGILSFAQLNPSAPARWQQTDLGASIAVRVQASSNPMGNAATAVAQIQRAIDAWNGIPESRVQLTIQDSNYDFTGSHSRSPAEQFSDVNVILFGDPYEDISDPTDCLGVLAVGGYWRSESLGSTVNNVAFYPALQLYVIFNDNFECFLSDPDNLAEVAAHELGHGLGFGHSNAPDSIMRSVAYGGRGPRLGDDDRDVAHCHYPHTLHLLEPNGGQAWLGGSLQAVRWSSTAEAGPDAGVVDLEYSTDDGASWHTIAADEPNDGYYSWLVPYAISADVRVRVMRPHRGDSVPPVYPASCSGDASDLPLSILPPPLLAGTIHGGGGLRAQYLVNGEIELSWPPSCSTDADDYVVYEGSLDSLRSGVWDHRPASCSAGVDLWESLVPSPGDRYYLVAPAAGPYEGGLGRSSAGSQRPASTATCLTPEPWSECY
jgi:hypothetical protein